jgi:tripartite motif-containing protein 2/3
VAVNATGNIIVADSGKYQVQVLNSNNGSFICSFGSEGCSCGQTMYPMGVMVDMVGNIIVANWGNHQVQVWRRDRWWSCPIQLAYSSNKQVW